MAKVFKLVKVCIRIALVHKNSRKIKVFGEFLKFFILAYLVCQRALSTYDTTIFFTRNLDCARIGYTIENELHRFFL